MKAEKVTLSDRKRFSNWDKLTDEERDELARRYPKNASEVSRKFESDRIKAARQAEIEADKKNNWANARAREERQYRNYGSPDERRALAEAEEQLRRQASMSQNNGAEF